MQIDLNNAYTYNMYIHTYTYNTYTHIIYTYVFCKRTYKKLATEDRSVQREKKKLTFTVYFFIPCSILPTQNNFLKDVHPRTIHLSSQSPHSFTASPTQSQTHGPSLADTTVAWSLYPQALSFGTQPASISLRSFSSCQHPLCPHVQQSSAYDYPWSSPN